MAHSGRMKLLPSCFNAAESDIIRFCYDADLGPSDADLNQMAAKVTRDFVWNEFLKSWQRALHLQLPLLPHKRLFFAQNKKPGLSTQHSKAVFTRRFDLVAANRRHYLRNDLSRCFGKQLKTVAAPDYSDECNCFCWKDAVDIALSELQSMVQQEKSRSDNAWYHNSL